MTELKLKTENGGLINIRLEALFDTDDNFKPLFCTKRTLNDMVKLIVKYATAEQIIFLKGWLAGFAPWFAEKYEKILTGGKDNEHL